MVIVVYDIPNDKRGTKLSKFLEGITYDNNTINNLFKDIDKYFYNNFYIKNPKREGTTGEWQARVLIENRESDYTLGGRFLETLNVNQESEGKNLRTWNPHMKRFF